VPGPQNRARVGGAEVLRKLCRKIHRYGSMHFAKIGLSIELELGGIRDGHYSLASVVLPA